MLAGISILCFAASYSVALALEASRPFFRSGLRGAVMYAFALAGFAAQTLYLVYRAATTNDLPLSSEFDWYLLAAWLLVGAYLGLTLSYPRTAVGLFILPLVLGLLAVARFLADQHPFPQSKAIQGWGMVHGAFLLLGTVSVLVGFVAGVMHLMQSYRLKHKLRPLPGFQFPSLERLERANTAAVEFSALMLLAGFLAGVVLNVVTHSSGTDKSVPWTDPVVVSSGLLLAWMLAAALFSLAYKPARQGRKVAYLTVASFVFLVLALGTMLVSPTEHGRGPAPEKQRSSPGSGP